MKASFTFTINGDDYTDLENKLSEIIDHLSEWQNDILRSEIEQLDSDNHATSGWTGSCIDFELEI